MAHFGTLGAFGFRSWGFFWGQGWKKSARLKLGIYKLGDIWIFDVNDQNQKRIKNKSAERLIPLHPVVVEQLECPEYVERIRAKGHVRIFPELKRIQGCFGHSASRWFSHYKNRVGISADSKKSFHSYQRQGEIIRDLAMPQKTVESDASEIAEEVVKRLVRAGVNT